MEPSALGNEPLIQPGPVDASPDSDCRLPCDREASRRMRSWVERLPTTFKQDPDRELDFQPKETLDLNWLLRKWRTN